MAGEFEQRLATAVGILARERALKPEVIYATLLTNGLSGQNTKRTLKALIRITGDCRRRGQFGRLRASILTGTTLLGAAFITPAERAGVFLSDDMPPRKFPEFLEHLKSETSLSANQDWRTLHERLETYCAYQGFAAALVQDERKALALLRARPRFTIKKVLALTHLAR